MEFLRCCGPLGYLNVLLGLVGLAMVFTIGRAKRMPGTLALGFAVAIVALGIAAFGVGAHAIEQAVAAQSAGDVAKLLAIGYREASGNLLLAGVEALLVLIAGAVASLTVHRAEAPVGKAQPAP